MNSPPPAAVEVEPVEPVEPEPERAGVVNEATTTETAETEEFDDIPSFEINKMRRHRVAELREMCERRGLSDDGKKDELIDRLREWNQRGTSRDETAPAREEPAPEEDEDDEDGEPMSVRKGDVTMMDVSMMDADDDDHDAETPAAKRTPGRPPRATSAKKTRTSPEREAVTATEDHAPTSRVAPVPFPAPPPVQGLDRAPVAAAYMAAAAPPPPLPPAQWRKPRVRAAAAANPVVPVAVVAAPAPIVVPAPIPVVAMPVVQQQPVHAVVQALPVHVAPVQNAAASPPRAAARRPMPVVDFGCSPAPVRASVSRIPRPPSPQRVQAPPVHAVVVQAPPVHAVVVQAPPVQIAPVQVAPKPAVARVQKTTPQPARVDAGPVDPSSPVHVPHEPAPVHVPEAAVPEAPASPPIGTAGLGGPDDFEARLAAAMAAAEAGGGLAAASASSGAGSRVMNSPLGGGVGARGDLKAEARRLGMTAAQLRHEGMHQSDSPLR